MLAAAHSIAEIVAHLAFWQEWFTRRCEGEPVPMVSHAALGWPTVAVETWPDVRDRFLSGLERLARLAERSADLDARVNPPMEFPPLGEYTVHDVVLHVAQHNAHHLGQVIVLRQLVGQWPPPSGSWTW